MDVEIFEELRAKLAPTHRGKIFLAGLVVAILLVAVIGGRLIIDTATANDFQLERASETAQEAQDSARATPASVFVHVTGCVANPGLYELPEGSRVADAVSAAGGVAEGADTTSLNLARKVTDGEQVIVTEEGAANQAPINVGSSGQSGSAPRVNVNTASASELETVPGIGPSTAGKIIAERQANGSFATVDDLTRVSGIGEKKLESLREYVCV